MSRRRLLPKFARRRIRSIGESWQRLLAIANVHRARLARGRPHALPGELIVSLTSYPARFATLHLTLRSLLAQSVKPDRLLLWIAHDDVAVLPAAVRALERFGLEIRPHDDLRSYKKLVPALKAFPDAFIATADDDIFYPRRWLEGLVSGLDPAGADIVCHRAHRPLRTDDGRLAPYRQWAFDVQDAAARAPSPDIMPTGVGGVLYPPGSLHPMVTDRAAFQRLCPHGDDLWFYWCARMAGTRFRKVGDSMRLVSWPGSQASSLWADNKRGGNDEMIRALEIEFGTDQFGIGS